MNYDEWRMKRHVEAMQEVDVGYVMSLEDLANENDVLKATIHNKDVMLDVYRMTHEMEQADIIHLRYLLSAFVQQEEGPCEYDHHGYCQSHFMTKPCILADAREYLAKEQL